MPGFLLHSGATVMCAHGGQAQPTVPFPRVTVSGMAIATMASPHMITGCPFTPPSGNGPCVTAQWIDRRDAHHRRRHAGVAAIERQAICAPTATPLNIILTQTRVTGL